MTLRIVFIDALATDGTIDVGSGDAIFLRKGMAENGHRLPMEEIQKAVVDSSTMYAQLVDAVAEIVRLRPSKLVTCLRQAPDPRNALGVCNPVAPREHAQPVENRRITGAFLIEHNSSTWQKVTLV